ncbi:MAG TPA: hypothetical protein DF383_05465, partial [Deltaproteobacteria bacterium]|nr:hypothetical protein [Deltaproteobacteria bacterium]
FGLPDVPDPFEDEIKQPSPDRLKQLLQHPFATGLESLSLPFSDLGTRHAKVIASMKTLTQLKSLNVRGNGLLGIDGLTILVQSPHLRLREFIVSNNFFIDDNGTLLLAKGPNFHELLLLDASWNDLDPMYIAASKAFPKLQHLILKNINVNYYEVILSSKTLTELQYIEFGPDIPSENIIATIQQMPDFRERFPYLTRINDYKRLEDGTWVKTTEAPPKLEY